MKSLYTLLFVALLFLSGCTAAKMAPKYTAAMYAPELNALNNTFMSASLNISIAPERAWSGRDGVVYTGEFERALQSYLNTHVPHWYIGMRFTGKEVKELDNLDINIVVSRNGLGNTGANHASVKIVNKSHSKSYEEISVEMESQSSMRADDPSYLFRESNNFGVVVGRKILNVLAGDKELIANASAMKKRFEELERLEEEQEILEEERANPENSLKRANEIFVELEKTSKQSIILNSINAYKKAKSEGYKPQQIPGIHPKAIVVTKGGGAYNVEFSLDSERLLEAVPMKLKEAKSYIKKHSKEGIAAIQLAPGTFKREVTEQSKVSSKYIIDYLVEQNPAYYAAQLDYQRALNNYNRTVAQNSASTTTGGNAWAGALIGGLSGLSNGLAQQKIINARNRLAQISPTRKIPQYKSYEYDKMTVSVNKHVPYSVYHIKDKKVQQWKGAFTEDRSFTIVYNKKAEDSGSSYSSHNTEADVENYEKAGVFISGKDVTKLLVSKAKPVRVDNSYAYLNPPTKKKSKAISKKTKATKSKIEKLMESVVAIQNNGNDTIGTGFFIKDNLILTNRHVIDGKTLVTIHTKSGKKLLGKVINVHHDIDLALVKVDYSGKPVTFYNSRVSPGSDVLAIGNPVGLEYSLTKGVVSSVRIREDDDRPLAEKHLYIQTDVAINPGNSGGPLFLNGKVVGVNTWKLVAKDIEGIGFAIHYDEVLKYLKDANHEVTPESRVASSNKKKASKKPKSPPTSSTVQKMKDLKYMHENQLITAEEYEQKRKKLLEAM